MILSKENVDDLLAAIAGQAALYVPKTVNGVEKFAPCGTGGAAELDMAKTLLPPKDVLFPQAQNMYHYGVDTAGDLFIDPIVEAGEQVLFGVRPCDVASIERLDDVFLTRGYVDEHYEAKREKLTIVALACTEPGETCFCESVGGNPNAAPGADILLRDCGDAFLVSAQTQKGEDAVEGVWAAYVQSGEPEPVDVHCSLQLDTADMMRKFAALYDSEELWGSYSAKCLNCGTCTFSCPTCYCFDIDQENRCKEGVRFRCWDSCMFSEYTQMAGGHNPRPTKLERFRNRFMHKLSWYEERYGSVLCVGCGRCMEKCPVGVDITVLVERANMLYEKRAHAEEVAHV